MHTLLLGNGSNRISRGVNWTDLLHRLATEFKVAHLVEYMEQKPLSILFEELCAHCGRQETFRATELLIKRKIASLVGGVSVSDLHRKFTDRFPVILTTNYDDTLERSMNGCLAERTPVYPESRYSLFRRATSEDKEIWHIHGDTNLPDSIVLGYDHYAGYLQKIRNYLTDGLRLAKEAQLVRSPT